MINKGELIDNRYEIIKSIGEGGMANVYLAFDTILEREVAVKVLRGDLSDDELKEYSSMLPNYKNKFSEYISRYYNSLLDKYGDKLFESGKLTYSDIFEMVDYIDKNNSTTNRNISFME